MTDGGQGSTEAPTSDFFVSYAQEDVSWAEWIAWQVELEGFSVILQSWDFLVGQNRVARLDEALAASTRVIAVVSTSYLNSEWDLLQSYATLGRDPGGRLRMLFPVAVEDCRIEGILSSVVGIEIWGIGENAARERLQQAVRSLATDTRGKPDRLPPYPLLQSRSARFPAKSPIIWGVDWPRNPNFVGRSQEISLLRERLLEDRGTVSVLPQALHGMGGVGKTQLTVEYVYRHARSYDLVWWINAEFPTLFVAGLAELAERISVHVPGQAEESATRAIETLRRGFDYPSWLIIVDNVSGPDDLQSLDQARRLLSAASASQGGHVVLTSRDSRWSTFAQPIEIDVLPHSEAIELLRARAHEIGAVDAGTVATAVDGLPLALEQAGAWLAETGMPVAEYIGYLQRQTKEIMSHGAPPGQKPISMTWSVALNKLDDPVAASLAKLWAHFGPEAIPIDLLKPEAAEFLPEELGRAVESPLRLRSAISVLVRLALVRRIGDAVVMHRLVQAVLREESGASERTLLRTAAHKLLAAGHPAERTTPEGWRRYARLYPHVIATDLVSADDPACRELVLWVIRYLRSAGDYTSSIAFAREVHNRWSESIGSDHLDTLSAELGLAHTIWSTGDYRTARKMEEHVLERRVEILGENHPDTVKAAANLGATIRDMGDYEAARGIFQWTLERRREIFGEDHPDTLTSASNLAHAHRVGRDYVAARDLYSWVFERRSAVLGDLHPRTLSAQNGLAESLYLLGDFTAARESYGDSLEKSSDVLGENHPDTLRAMAGLAESLRGLEDLTAARALYERVVERRTSTLGNDHPDTLKAMVGLAETLRGLEDLAAARALYERVVERRTSTLGADHPDTLSVHQKLIEISS
ncbi:FxSxx-COOH system tetratricopeptide repeat protein [Frankia sp. R43]|uniref:FxSxx-COOH system tetratricopeptide repeat protein n=1 Tax=Frankia sp. R43 TaxID=269536 RepID=UPI0009FB7328|nr:FxSxx-COOH system tetratricopeptide repeat protein [Frankia sp. R43]